MDPSLLRRLGDGLLHSYLVILAPFIVISLIFVWTYAYTHLRYRLSMATSPLSISQPAGQDKLNPTPPPRIPYSIPFLGNALSFLAPRPGLFWAELFRRHPRMTGACTLLLGGRETHVLFSQSAVQALFKNRALGREEFNFDVVAKALGVPAVYTTQYYGYGEGVDPNLGMTPEEAQEHMNHEWLLKNENANELAAIFARFLHNQVAKELSGPAGSTQEVSLYSWLRSLMFASSTNALMGSRLLEVYPELPRDFFDYDSYMLTLLFGIPKFFAPDAYASLDKVMAGMLRWHKIALEECEGRPASPLDSSLKWEPIFGSRVNRARQNYYLARGLKSETGSRLDLGFIFGLSSNAIPCTGWILLHLLDPNGDPKILSRIIEELNTAVKEDGTLNMPVLLGLPLLQSVFNEILRLYVDVLVTRQVHDDLVLPLDDGHRQVLFRKNSVIMAPSWLGHRDESLWMDPPADVFYAERFLKTDPDTGKEVFSISGTNGKLFPFVSCADLL